MNENKNKFEKLTDPSQKRGSLFPSADERICLGCLHGPQLASTSGNFKAISSSSLSFGGGIGAKGRRGCQIQSVINEHFKRPNCGR